MNLPLVPCRNRDCRALTVDGYCPGHPRRDTRSAAAHEWHSLYNNARWRRYRRAFLTEHPLCVDPFGDHGPERLAGCVDHIQAHRGDPVLFWDPGNHQALCIPCNSKRAVVEQGGGGWRR